MADPNRTINLDLASSDQDESDDQEFAPEEIELVKEFEEEFKNRFTEDDEIFMNFCKGERKPPPIIYPFDTRDGRFHHRGRGGGGYHYNNRGRGGGYRGGYRNNNDNYHHHRQNNYHHRSSNEDCRPPDNKQRRYNP